MVAAYRFTVFGGLVAALRAVVRRPISLTVALVADVVLTAGIAWLDHAWLDQFMLGRLLVVLGHLFLDATVGTWVMLLVASAFAPRLSVRETLARVGRMLVPAVVVNAIDGGAIGLTEVLIREPTGNEPWLLPLALGLALMHFVVAVWVGCTIAFAPFVASARPMSVRTALRESLALTSASRWRLAFFAFWLAVASSVVSALTPTAFSPLQAALSQGTYSVFYIAGVILTTGMGLALTRATLDRHLSLAETFD